VYDIGDILILITEKDGWLISGYMKMVKETVMS